MDEQLTALAAKASDSTLTAALTAFAAESRKAAKAADPSAAAGDPDFAAAGTNVTAACKTIGVDVNF